MQKCITCTRKIHKMARALREAQIHCGIKEKRLLTPVSTRFAYLIHSFRHLLEKNVQLSISMDPCQGFMIISGQGELPLLNGRSFT